MNNAPTIEVHPEQLRAHPLNVRRTRSDPQKDRSLEHDISESGLIQNLVVVPSTKGGAPYEVIAGVRRMRAIKRLVKKGRWVGTVRCQLRRRDEVRLISLKENQEREAMHPADVAKAVRDLVQTGKSAEQVSEALGRDIREIDRMVRIASVTPVIFEAWREGKLSTSQVHAYACTAEHERQEEIFSNDPTARDYRIRELIRRQRTQATSPAARYVGLEEYEKAGGRVERDLFAEDDTEHWLLDPDIMTRSARERMECEHAEQIQEEGWKNVLVDPNLDWDTWHRYGHAPRATAEPTEKENERNEELRNTIAKLHDKGHHTWTRRDRKQYEELERGLRQIETQVRERDVFTDEVKKRAVAIVRLNDYGEVTVHRGMVEDEGEENDPGYDEKTREKNTPEGMSDSVINELAAVRTALLREKLAEDPDAAMDLVMFEICASAVSRAPGTLATEYRQALLVPRNARMSQQTGSVIERGNPIPEIPEEVDLGGISGYEQWSKLSNAKKRRMFARSVARSVVRTPCGAGTPASAALDAVARSLDVEITTNWQPGERILKKLPRRMLDELAREYLPEEHPGRKAKASRSAIAKAIEERRSAEDCPEDLDHETWERMRKWSPPGLGTELKNAA